MFSRRRDNRAGFGLLMLGYQLMSHGLDRIPPVTLAAIAGQVVVFLGFVPMLDPKYRTYDLCIRPDRVWWRGEWQRLIYPTVMHASDMHLYFNMVSLLWKGSRLEKRLGSVKFAVILCLFGVLTNLTTVLVSVGLEEQLHFDLNLMRQCAVGFSGVLFGLKVLSNHYSPYDTHSILGLIPVPSRYACWAELLVIHFLVPNSSLIGHLSGILVGFAYLHTPLCNIVDGICDSFASPPRGYENDYYNQDRYRNQTQYQNRSTTFGSGTWGGGLYTTRYEEYTAGLSEEEQIRRATDASRQNAQWGNRPYGNAPPYPAW